MKKTLLLSIVFSVILTLILVGFANATDAGVFDFRGTASFPIKITSQGDNGKFKTSTTTFMGTIDLFMSEEGGLVAVNGCVMLFSGEDGTTLCITEAVGVPTHNPKSSTGKFLLIGIGDFSTPTTVAEKVSGMGYLDSKGTFTGDQNGNPTSISMNGKIAGGIVETPGMSDSEKFVFSSASFKCTLSRQ